MPCRFISDNGKTFKAAAKVIKGIVGDEEVKVAINHLPAPPLCEAIQTHDAIDMRFNAHRTQLIMVFV